MSKLLPLLKNAQQNGYALPAFNFADMWELEAIIEAAEAENSPVLVASIPKVVDAHSCAVIAGMAKPMIEKAHVPVILHLDHSVSIDMCKQAVDCGYDSVMIDGSKLPLFENIAAVKEVVNYAHARDICVEGEIGQIMGRGYEGNFEGGDYLVQVPEAVELVEKTGVDSLAVGIGTAHGFYKGEPKLNFERLEQVREKLDIPLVLHGGTGIPVEDVQHTIRLGMCKVNVGTAIWHAHVKALDECFRSKGLLHTIDANEYAKESVREVVSNAIHMCMSNNKA
ncbi:tagatose bisphosphate family class II aldolase [Agathobaculum sp. TL06]